MIKIIETFNVSPSSQEQLPSQTSLPLTFFDIFWLRLPPVQRIFFYEFLHPNSLFFNTLLPKLIKSLSHTLFHFYPLLGHLIWPHDSHKPIIKHLKGNSLLLTVAESDADFNNLSVINDPNGLDEKYVSDWLKQGGTNNRSLMVWDLQLPEESTRGLFRLTRLDIEKLKEFVVSKQKGTNENKKLHLSTFVVSIAYTWVCSVKAEEIENKNVMLAVNIDCRNRLDQPVLATYFGNCIGARMAIVETSKLLGEDGIIVAIEVISETLETLKDGVLNGAENWTSWLLEGVAIADVKTIGAACSPKFEVYSADFSFGRPKKVEMASIDRTGAFCISDCRNGDGVEIGFVSKIKAMEAFASLFTKGIAS
ncbi:hypothetical protein P8452_58884 [Trifolium repens]|nr:hypothetical protein P8452_58884 [Trifolium repens]